MNLDRTWCSGKRCGRTRECAISMVTLRKYLDDNPQIGGELCVNLASYADQNGNCNEFCGFSQAPLVHPSQIKRILDILERIKQHDKT